MNFEKIDSVSEELQIRIVAWFLLQEGCSPVAALSRLAAVFVGPCLDPSLIHDIFGPRLIDLPQTEEEDRDFSVSDNEVGTKENLKTKPSIFQSRQKVECRYCNKTCTNKYRLNSHILKIHAESAIKCQHCEEKTFGLEDLLEKHIRLSHKNAFGDKKKTKKINDKSEDIVECKKCDKIFKSNRLLNKHYKISHNVLICKFCGDEFFDKKEFNNHTSRHGIACVMCTKIFSTRAAYLEHRRSEHDNKSFTCEWCAKSFTSKDSLNKHQKRTHNNDHISDCAVDQDCETSEDTQDKESVKIMLVCDECNKSFQNQDRLQKHVTSCHEGKKKPYKCTMCSQNFVHKYDLNVHLERHSSSPNYSCDTDGCDKKFFTKTDMKRHVKVSHLKEYAGSCEICGRKFQTIGGLEWKQHMDTHNQSRTLKCPYCFKCFSTDYSLKSHLVSHSDTRSWSCSMCPKTFKRLKNVKYHVKTAHNIENEQELRSCCTKLQSEPTKSEIQEIVNKRQGEMKLLHANNHIQLRSAENTEPNFVMVQTEPATIIVDSDQATGIIVQSDTELSMIQEATSPIHFLLH